MSQEKETGTKKPSFNTRIELIDMKTADVRLMSMGTQQKDFRNTLKEAWEELIELMDKGGFITGATGETLKAYENPPYSSSRKWRKIPAGFQNTIVYTRPRGTISIYSVNEEGKLRPLDSYIEPFCGLIQRRWEESNIKNQPFGVRTAVSILFHSYAKEYHHQS